MYCIIERSYVGPNRAQNVDADTIEISTTPARTNQSNEPRTEGWCGTTNDRYVYAHGEYDTIEEARAAIALKFGVTRDVTTAARAQCDDEDVIEIHKAGRYEPMNRGATEDWVYDGLQHDIEATTTDERIAELVAEYEGAANEQGMTLDSLEDIMLARRQQLRDEQDDEAA